MVSKKSCRNLLATQRGFTFLEVMVVVAILGMLATVIFVNYTKRMDQAKLDTANLHIQEIKKALEMFKLDNGFYPTTEQGLFALVEKPESSPEPKKWKKYMEKIPKDPWNNNYIYICPSGEDTRDYDLFSKGPDGVESEEDDITSWVKEKDKNTPTND